MFTPQEYINLQSEPLPYTSPWGFTVEETEGYCPQCNRKLTQMKHTITEYSNFIIIRPVGLCRPCQLVVSTYPMKVTDEDEFFFLKNGQWYVPEKSWIDKIMKWFQK